MTTTIDHLDDARHHAGAMDDTTPPDPEVPERSPGRRRFSARYKAKILAEYDALEDKTARGALLRREGIYSSNITTLAQPARQELRAHSGPIERPAKDRPQGAGDSPFEAGDHPA